MIARSVPTAGLAIEDYLVDVNRLQGKVAVITGAAGGLGSALSRLFVDEGGHLLMTDIDVDRGRALASELGPNASFARLDVSSEADWSAVIGRLVEEKGRVDVLVNNAAILLIGPILQFSASDPHFGGSQSTRVLLGRTDRGPSDGGRRRRIDHQHLVRRRYPRYAGRCRLRVDQMGSARNHRVAAVELGSSGVRVNAIPPGGMRTAMASPTVNVNMGLIPAEQIIDSWPLGRLSDPREVATSAVFLASDESSFCTGAEFIIDGGATAGPPYLDHHASTSVGTS